MKQVYPPNADSESSLYSSDAFRMFCFKVLPCSKRFCHDWVTCPFAHPAEKAKRRDPRAFTYTGVACPDQKKNATCPRGDACTFAHNVFEYHLHPSRYRTQLCNDGANCARKICFFAHSMDELRVSSVKVVPPDSAAANKLGSPSGSGDFDADPFGGQNDDVLGALKQRSSTSPVSPLYAESWDQPSNGRSVPSRRSSLQLQQKQQQRQQRMSLDQAAMRPQGHQAAGRQQRNSADLASELQIQQLQLSAMKAQLQLQQSALQSLGVGQPDINATSVAQLAQALAQLQMATGLASPEQLLPALQQQQQMMPNLTQVLMQQMLLQQQAQAHVQAAQAQAVAHQAQQAQGQLLQQLQNQVLNAQAASGMPDLAAVSMLMPGQQTSMSSGFAMPGSGGGGMGLSEYNGLSKMNSLPGPDLSPLQGLSKMPSLPGPDLSSMHGLCSPANQAASFTAGSQGLMNPAMAFDSIFAGQTAFAGHGTSSPSKEGDDAGH